MDGEQHVVADLGRLAVARVARMDHRLAHRGQDRLGAREGFLGAADHEGQRAAVRCRDAARDGRIDHVVTRASAAAITSRAVATSMVEQSSRIAPAGAWPITLSV